MALAIREVALHGEGVLAGPAAYHPPATTAGLTDRLLATLCSAGQVGSRRGYGGSDKS